MRSEPGALRILPLFHLVPAATAALTVLGARQAELRALAWRWAYVTLVAPEYFHAYLRTYLATDMRVDGILCGAALAVRPPRLLQVRPLVRLGAVSYAAYLTHRAVLETLERLLGSPSALLGFGWLALTRRHRPRAGTPVTTAPAGTSLVTTAPAPTKACAPTVRP